MIRFPESFFFMISKDSVCFLIFTVYFKGWSHAYFFIYLTLVIYSYSANIKTSYFLVSLKGLLSRGSYWSGNIMCCDPWISSISPGKASHAFKHVLLHCVNTFRQKMTQRTQQNLTPTL